MVRTGISGTSPGITFSPLASQASSASGFELPA